MPQITTSDQITSIEDDPQKFRYIQLFLQNVKSILNGNIEFDKNMLINSFSVDFTVANSDTTIVHNLGKIPKGYIIIGKTVAMDVYDGTITSTTQNITLKSTVVGTAKIIFL